MDEHFSRAWTEDQLADLRRESVRFFEEAAFPVAFPIVFTCDDCGLRFACEFAFDTYNTDGDCLADK